MPLPSLHPLPNNPTTGQAPPASFSSRSGPPPASAAGGGGVSRETLKGLQDVYWSDDEVRVERPSLLPPSVIFVRRGCEESQLDTGLSREIGRIKEGCFADSAG